MKFSTLIKLISKFFLIFIISSSAHAMGIKEYQTRKNYDKDLMEMYIVGLGAGFSYSNVMIELRDEKPLFCPPGKLVFNVENYMNIIDTQIKKYGDDDSSIEILLYYGLVEVFPCPKKK